MRKLGITAMIIAAIPASRWLWGEAAGMYFDYRCQSLAGESIVRVATGVDGLYQMRPREPKDYFDRVRDGDLPPDPYGHTNVESQRPWNLFLRHGGETGRYEFLETKAGPYKGGNVSAHWFANEVVVNGAPFWIYRRAIDGTAETRGIAITAHQVPDLISDYGFTWREFRSPWDRLFGVWGSELIAVELATNETLGVRTGFFFQSTWSDRGGLCPAGKHDWSTRDFLVKVLKPSFR